MNINKKLKKTLFICGATLITLSIAPATAISANKASTIPSSNFSHSSIYNTGENDAKSAYDNIHKNGISSILKILIQHPNDYLNNKEYRKGFNKITNKYEEKSHSKEYRVSSTTKKIILKGLKQYKGLNSLGKKGFYDSCVNPKFSMMSNQYRHNYPYAIGFIKGAMIGTDLGQNIDHDANFHYKLEAWTSYLNSGGKMKFSHFATNNQSATYYECLHITRTINENALTPQQGENYLSKKLKQYDLSKSTYNSISKIILGSFGNGNFASQLIRRAPFHENFYFPSRYTKSNAHQLNGIIIGMENNKNAKVTAKAYHAFLTNLYSGHENKKLSQKFHNQYNIETIGTNKHKWSTGYATVYHIYNKKQPKSTIAYVMPFGWQGFSIKK